LPWAFAGASLGAAAELSGSHRFLVLSLAVALVFGGLHGGERKLRWETDFPVLDPSVCVPASLASGEPACELVPNRPCYEPMCVLGPATAIEARRPGHPGEGFRKVPPPLAHLEGY
jgi:hypothetical protein